MSAVCSKCGQEKPLSEFYVYRKNGRQHREGICKQCRRAQQRRWYRLKKSKRARKPATGPYFGPLPGREGSEKWIKEIWRRAAIIRAARPRPPAEEIRLGIAHVVVSLN